VARLTDDETKQILALVKTIKTETTLEPVFTNTLKDGSLVVRGLSEGFFVEYLKKQRPHLRYSKADEGFFDYDDETGLFQNILQPVLQDQILEEILKFRSAFAGVSPQLSERMEEFRNLTFAQRLVGRLQGRCNWRGNWNEWEGGHYIHTLNKILVLDTETGEAKTRRFSPKFNSTACIQVKYDPKATCPNFEDNLQKGIPDPELRNLFLKCLGQMLIKTNLAHKILVLVGKSNTGKSAVARVVLDIVGANNSAEIRLSETAGRFEMAQYRNATLLYAFEVPADFFKSKNTDVLKKLTGGDEIGGEQKFAGQVNYRGDKCVFITSNFELRLREGKDEAALARRLVFIKWQTLNFKKRNAKWPSFIIKNEGGGVLNLLLGGLKMALKDLQQGCVEGFDKVEANTKAVDEVLAASNSVQRFVSTMVEPANGKHILLEEFHEAYNEFCAKHGIAAQHENIASKLFNEAVSETFNAHKGRLSVSICGLNETKFRPWAWKNIILKSENSGEKPVEQPSKPAKTAQNGSETAIFDLENELAEKVDY
jgi:P4 family phage/plasmid primase-like protien